MLKKVFLLFLFTFLFLSLNLDSVNAQGIRLCNNPQVQTNPNPLYNNTPNARFVIDIGNNKEPGVNSWKVQFLCGAEVDRDATLESGDTNIGVSINNGGILGSTICPFDSTRPVGVKVKAVTSTGIIDFCSASYQVLNIDTTCSLSLSAPTPDITITTPITINGSNLSTSIPGHFALFIDNKGMNVDLAGLLFPPRYSLSTPTFTKLVPSSFTTQGAHTVDIRKRRSGNPISLNVADFFGPPLCTASFTVGTAAQPGRITVATPSNKKAATSGEQSVCNSDPSQIRTAVGCINTSPVKFIQDILRFAIGIAGGIAFLFMIGGVFQILTSAGNPDALKSGQGILTNAVIGLMFLIFSTLLLKIIGVDILNFGSYF